MIIMQFELLSALTGKLPAGQVDPLDKNTEPLIPESPCLCIIIGVRLNLTLKRKV